MTQTRKMLFGVVGALSACVLMACDGPAATMGPKDYGDITGVEEIGQPLTAFSAVAWDAGTGAMTLNFAAADTLLVVAKHPVSGAILVNDVATAATATSLKKLFISGYAGAATETVILDFANGTFAPGVTGAGGQGIYVNLGDGAANAFKVRGSGTAVDTVSLGGTAMAGAVSFNVDAFPDITVLGSTAISYTFSLGGGNDVFNATTTQYGVTGPFQATAGTVAATGTLTTLAQGVGAVLDGETFTLADGIHPPVVFEFDVAGGGVTAGNVPVVIAALAADTVVAAAMRTAITGAANLDLTPTAAATAVVTLTNDNLGAVGNVTITETVVAAGFTVSGMASGVGGGGAGVTVYGGLGDDTLTGSAGNDFIYGDLGTDTLSGGNSATDNDVISGGASFADGGGLDTVTYAARTNPVFITVGTAANDGEINETDDINIDVETVIGGAGADTFTGGAGAQTFFGGAGNDTFIMGALASTGAGSDIVWGGAGTDTVSYAARTAAVTVTMDGVAANDGESGENDNVQVDVENFICPTGAYVCTITGNLLDNAITGGAGADVMVGGAGDDTFIMGANGGIGLGADQISGGTGTDTVDFSTFGVAIDVKMDFTASTTMSKKINTDVENLVCPNYVNTVVANDANNHLYGGTAADTIDGVGGDDFIEGGGGADVITCGDGSDVWTGRATGTNALLDCEL